MGPQVVAHRGASHDLAEHTLAAYIRALDAGADGLECDVRLTADGHLVCVHDRTLRRTAATRGLISTSNLQELEALDFARWKNPWADLDDEAPAEDPGLTGVLTLRRLLETVADYDRRVEIAIETKHPTRYGGLVEKRVCELLNDFGWAEAPRGERPRARVMSFSHTALQRMEKLCPQVPLVQLVDKKSYLKAVRPFLDPSWILGPGIEMLREHPKLARKIAGSGHEVHVWTVNNPTDLALCRDLGVTTVITDRPAYLLELLER